MVVGGFFCYRWGRVGFGCCGDLVSKGGRFVVLEVGSRELGSREFFMGVRVGFFISVNGLGWYE